MSVELLDVEGTIGPVSFVRDVLFPHARERLDAFLARPHDAEEQGWIDEARALAGAVDDVALLAALRGWIDADRKVGPLKAIQGRIWRDGYGSGALRAPLYPDAVAAMQRWRAEGRRVAIYSSGSEEAVRLYLRHAEAGDLEDLVEACFDTRVGSKTAPASYVRIAELLAEAPAAVRFWTDAPAEVEAARAAGLQVRWVVRAATGPAGGPCDPVSTLED